MNCNALNIYVDLQKLNEGERNFHNLTIIFLYFRNTFWVFELDTMVSRKARRLRYTVPENFPGYFCQLHQGHIEIEILIFFAKRLAITYLEGVQHQDSKVM